MPPAYFQRDFQLVIRQAYEVFPGHTISDVLVLLTGQRSQVAQHGQTALPEPL